MDQELLEILACPECKAPVELVGRVPPDAPNAAAAGPGGPALQCTACGKRYPIRDGIPIMLVEEAQPPAAGWKPKLK